MSPLAGCSVNVLYAIVGVLGVLPASERIFSVAEMEILNTHTSLRRAARELLALSLKVLIAYV